MKQLFKTTLLAAAVAATCGTAVAGDVRVTKKIHSKEGLLGVEAAATSNAIQYTLEAAYPEGDLITLTFPAGTLDEDEPSTGFPTSLTTNPVAGVAGLTIGYLNSTQGDAADTVVYRVTKIVPAGENGSTFGAVIGGSDDAPAAEQFTVGYSVDGLLDAPVTVEFSSKTVNGDVIDSSGDTTATIAEAKSQFGTTVTSGSNDKFDNTIDVGADRKLFADDEDGAVATDEFQFSINNPDSVSFDNQIQSASLEVNVYGEAGKMTGLAATDFVSSGTEAFVEDQAKLELTFANANTNDLIEIVQFVNPTDVALEPQSFTGDFTYEYVSSAGKTGTYTIKTGLGLGEWTLNGANVNVPYMPYGANVSQVLYVTNIGSQTGDVSVEAFDSAGTVYELGVVATAGADSVTKLTVPVLNALADQGFTAGKVSLNITVNAPAGDITVYSAYNVGSVRGYVNTDQYKGK